MENEVKEPEPKYSYISPEEYLEMERAHVEVYTRTDDHTWTFREFKEYDESFTIPIIDFTMSLRETYHDVNFY